jgi:hypothetical protein
MHLVHTRLRHRTRPPASIIFYFKNMAHLRRGSEVTDRSNLGLKIRGIRKGESRRAISPNRDDMCATCEICLYEVYEQVLRPSLCCMLDKCRHPWHSFRSRLCFHGIPIVLFQFLAGEPSGFVPDRSRPSEDLRAYHISEHANVTLQPYCIEIS